MDMHQLHTLAQEHPEARICIMSGSFVQRGEPAIFLNLTVLVGYSRWCRHRYRATYTLFFG